VQAGRRRRDGARDASEQALVPLAIGRLRRTRNIRRQRHRPAAFEEFERGLGQFQFPQVYVARQQAHRATLGLQRLTRTQWIAGAGLYQRTAARKRSLEEDLDASAAGAPRREARRQHACVVEHQQVAWRQQSGEVSHRAVDAAPTLPVEHQQTAGRALRERRLRDQLSRQGIFEIAAAHSRTNGGLARSRTEMGKPGRF
jgi:hypothetical protein